MAVTTMVFYGRLKNAVGDIFSKDNVALSLSLDGYHGRTRLRVESAMGYTRYFTGPSGEYRNRIYVLLIPFLALGIIKLIDRSRYISERAINIVIS